MSKFAPRTSTYVCDRALSANRFWFPLSTITTFDPNKGDNQQMDQGWSRVKNLSTYDTLRVHFGNAGEENRPYVEVAPQSDYVFQMPDAQDVFVSSGATGTQFEYTVSQEKPTPQTYTDFPQVQNSGIAALLGAGVTIVDCTVLAKGFADFFEVIATAVTSTVEYSIDGGLTYSAVIAIDSANPNMAAFNEEKVVTHFRVTVAGGGAAYYYGG